MRDDPASGRIGAGRARGPLSANAPDGYPGPFAAALHAAARQTGRPVPKVLPAEACSLLTADVPLRGIRAKRAALPFALEDRIGAPLDTQHVALCRAGVGGTAHSVLAVIVAVDAMRSVCDADDDGTSVLPETFALPIPGPGADGALRWAVWSNGGRVLIRSSDATGFAIPADLLTAFWSQAGRPALIWYGDPPPRTLPTTRHRGAPPPPDPADLACDLRQGAFAPASSDWTRPARRIAAILCVGIFGHLVILATDTAALSRIALSERRAAQDAIAPVLPGLTLNGIADADAALRRLAPAPQARQRGTFLPLLSDVSAALLDADTSVGIRRMSYGDDPALLTILLETGSQENLQEVARLLEERGFSVSTGVATAAEGLAEAEFRIARQGET